ncbi:MAG: hypothetical protein GEV06_16160 [Luteitalea sp.]|nr:hypothetical protein [Luteitalea sp.]
MGFRRASMFALVAALLLPPSMLTAQAPPPQTDEADAPRTVWYFYRVKWGAQERFLDLFQKNHYPVLQEQLGSRLVSINTYVPTYHGDGRADWTFAVALTFKNTAALVQPVDEIAIARQLYKDFAVWRQEERERFELLEAHWDVPLNEIDLETREPSGEGAR